MLQLYATRSPCLLYAEFCVSVEVDVRTITELDAVGFAFSSLVMIGGDQRPPTRAEPY